MMNAGDPMNYMFRNETWKCVSEAVKNVKLLSTDDHDFTKIKSKGQTTSIQENDRDAASSFLLMTAMHKTGGIFLESREQGYQRRRKEEQQQSIKSRFIDRLMQQNLQDKKVGLKASRSSGVRMAAKKFQASFDDRKWNQRIEEVKEFIAKHGHGRIPVSYPLNEDLARWSKRQRFHYKVYVKNKRQMALDITHKLERCHMTPERIKALKDAGFCFDLQVARWYCSFERLKPSKLHPSRRTSPELKKWIGTQCFQMSLIKPGGKSFLSRQERIQKFNDFRFSWCDSKLGKELKKNDTQNSVSEPLLRPNHSTLYKKNV